MFGGLVNFGNASDSGSWRDSLRPSSFRGVEFHVDAAARGGGRRQAQFEFPKKDTPYAEDMGRRARRYSVTAYIVGDDYQGRRDRLVSALEQEGAGLLNHYTLGQHKVVVETYSLTERRERGRMCEFEIQFAEAGSPPSKSTQQDTQSAVKSSSEKASDAAASGADSKAAKGADAGVWV